ncbi:hypothetical protein G4B88_030344 [Cannabis sativa]|uniref:Uncharacterized protein n=1 Tax=Cannabis sativa TaxID=3483 RepID=A0A7J6DJW8_CANSA|nr:hypothetical protein G4B88_030344 [Cannabis sativa]
MNDLNGEANPNHPSLNRNGIVDQHRIVVMVRQNAVESLGQGGHSALGRLPPPRDHRSSSWRSHSHRRLFLFPCNLCLLSPLELARENKVKENFCKFAKKGLTPSQIGVILTVKSVTGSKILRVLKAHVAETTASTILDIKLEWSWLNQVDQSLKFKGEKKSDIIYMKYRRNHRFTVHNMLLKFKFNKWARLLNDDSIKTPIEENN